MYLVLFRSTAPGLSATWSLVPWNWKAGDSLIQLENQLVVATAAFQESTHLK